MRHVLKIGTVLLNSERLTLMTKGLVGHLMKPYIVLNRYQYNMSVV